MKVSGTKTGGNTSRVNYKATIKINIPVTDGRQSNAVISIDDVRAPSASVTITQWDLEARNASPDSDGRVTTWSCRLAGPATVPMMAQGVLNLHYQKRTYSMYVSLVATEEVPLRCVNPRTGPYNQSESMGFFFGTNEPDASPYTELPLASPARIAAKYTLVPKGEMKGQYLPQEQEWELVLKR